MPLCLFTNVHFYDHNGKCACGRRATQDENLKEKKMTQDIRVGDIVCAKRKDTDGNDTEVHGTVRLVSDWGTGSILIGNLNLNPSAWSIEVTKRPYVFPTEPGLYIREGVDVSDPKWGIYRLVDDGDWWVLNPNGHSMDSATIKRSLELHRVKLVPLVVGEVLS